MEDEKKVFPVAYTLVDGRSVLLSPWSETDFEAMNKWVQKRYVSLISE